MTAPIELHQCPTTIATNTTGMILLTEVPIIAKEREPMQVYQLQTAPMKIGNEWVTVNPGPEDVIIVNHDRSRFRTLSRAELSTCKAFGTAFLCDHQNVVTKAQINMDAPQFCLLALLKEDYENIRTACKANLTPARNHMEQLNSNEFLSTSVTRTQVHIKCPGRALRAVPRRHIARFKMEAGCTAETPTHEARVITDGGVNFLEDFAFLWQSRADIEDQMDLIKDANVLAHNVSQWQKEVQRNFSRLENATEMATPIHFKHPTAARHQISVWDVLSWGLIFLLLGIRRRRTLGRLPAFGQHDAEEGGQRRGGHAGHADVRSAHGLRQRPSTGLQTPRLKKQRSKTNFVPLWFS